MIGDVKRSPGQMPQQKGIHGATEQLAALSPSLRAGNVVEQPAEFGRGVVRAQK
jgi:hypothetical protein